MAAAKQRADKHEIKATQRASGEARSLAQTMPRLILEARRIAATVIHGLHGRKRAGPGENFWQYRRFLSGEPARRVDWRRSARDEHLYVRELRVKHHGRRTVGPQPHGVRGLPFPLADIKMFVAGGAPPVDAARRIAATVIHGLHGRKRAGPGENFWQYRRFLSGEPARRVDWRRSARDEHLYVREREWEAAHTVWLWPDRSPSMVFRSQLAQESKLDRCLVVAFALAEILVQAGERVGMPGLMRPTGSRNVLDKMANAIVHDVTERPSLPPLFAPSSLAEIVVVSDFWSPMAQVRATLAQLSATGAHGHTVQIVDPAEETFPYSGRVEFIEPEGAGSITAGRAEAWKREYETRVARHRAEIRAETDKLGWSFTIHRTDRPATELLLALHARLGAPPPGAMVSGRLSIAGQAGRPA